MTLCSSVWQPAAITARCPVCAADASHDLLAPGVLAEARRVLSSDGLALEYVRCPACGCVHAPSASALDYRAETRDDTALRFYLEEGAGIDLMLAPMCRLDRTRVRRYAEIGCSFGFSLDLARHCFGWEVRGVDPSPLAERGRVLLGLPIERRFVDAETPLGPPLADLLQLSEVIEHVVDPHAFLRAAMTGLDPDGVLVVSTPNAAALEAGTPDSMLLQVLQPGIHLTLLSPRGLGLLAQANGLVHRRIHVTTDTLTLYASHRPFAYDPEAPCDRAAYLGYLGWRFAAAPPGTPLRRGLLSRTVRELTLQGRLAEIDGVLPELFAEYALSGLDLRSPETLRYSPAAPFNVAAILFCLGARWAIDRATLETAIRYFDAAVAWQSVAAAPLSLGGVVDASAHEVGRLARDAAADARIEIDPVGEHDRLVGAPHPSPLTPMRRRRLFAGLVNRGDHTRAGPHAEPVARDAEASDADSQTLFALGIHALNHADDAESAHRWFDRVIAATEGDPALEELCREAGIARAIATTRIGRGRDAVGARDVTLPARAAALPPASSGPWRRILTRLRNIATPR